MTVPDEESPLRRPPLWWTLLRLLRLQGSPSDIPYSTTALVAVALLDLAGSMLYLHQVEIPQALQRVVFGIALTLGLTGFALWQLNKARRFIQTAIALVGTDALLTLFLLPLAFYSLQLNGADPNDPQTQGVAIIWLAVYVWSLLVSANILRSAFDFPMAGGIAAAVGLFVTQLSLGQWLFGTPA